MSYHPKQFKDLIERVLMSFDPKLHSEKAVTLLLCTAAQESQFGTALRQYGSGPAVGAFQQEPTTFRWLQTKFAGEYPSLLQRYPMEMEWDLRLAIIMARLRYRVVPEELPATVEGMAAYWKKYYNTPKGKGTIDEFMGNWEKYVKGKV